MDVWAENNAQTAPALSPELVELLTTLTTLMLRGSAEGTFYIRSTVQKIAQMYSASADVLALPDSVLLIVCADGGQSSVVVNEAAEIPRLDMAAALKELVNEIIGAQLTISQALEKLRRLEITPPLYPTWALIPGVALFALGFGLSVQATWQQVILSTLLGALVGALALLPRSQPKLAPILPLLAAAVVSTIVLALYPVASLRGAPIELMIPALFFFIPGDFLSAGLGEIAYGRVSAGAIRLAQVAFQLLVLAVGALLGGILTNTQPDVLFTASIAPDFGWWVIVAGWLLFAVGMVWCFSIRWQDFGWVVLLVYIAFFAVQAGTFVFGALGGTFLAGIVASFVTSLLVRNPERPPYLVLILGAFFVLTVGAKGLSGLTAIASGAPIAGFESLVAMLEIATALSLGLLTGNICASLLPPKEVEQERLGVDGPQNIRT